MRASEVTGSPHDQEQGDDRPLPPKVIATWFLTANLQTIGQLQTLLAREGFELHIATAPVVMELPPGTFER